MVQSFIAKTAFKIVTEKSISQTTTNARITHLNPYVHRFSFLKLVSS